jgi:hypothetical protein
MDISEEAKKTQGSEEGQDSTPTDIMQKLLSSNLFKNEEQTSDEEDTVPDGDVGFEGKLG